MTRHRKSLTAVVTVLTPTPQLEATHARYRRALARLADEVQLIYVVDGPLPQARAALRELKRRDPSIEVLMFPQALGEAAALSVGLQAARSDAVLTLPADAQLGADDLAGLLDGLDGADIVIGRRSHVMAESSGRGRKLDSLVNRLFKTSLRDIRSPIRALRAEAARELLFYGNQYRFVPLLAQAQGFVVAEADVRTQPPAASPRGLLPFDLSLLLDTATVYFLLRFLRKPFRFFGGFGVSVLVIGLLVTFYLVFARLFLGVPLVDRPALILSTLLVVLGIQVISVGLIGEIVTFTYAKDIRDYRVERLVDGEPVATAPATVDA